MVCPILNNRVSKGLLSYTYQPNLSTGSGIGKNPHICEILAPRKISGDLLSTLIVTRSFKERDVKTKSSITFRKFTQENQEIAFGRQQKILHGLI